MRARYAAPLFLAFLIPSSPARAAEPPPHISIRLAYTPDPSVEKCPDERGFRDALMEKFGYDPTDPPQIFDVEAPPILRVLLSRRGQELRAEGSLKNGAGLVLWGDEYQGRIDCAGLVRIFALVIKIGIDAADVPRHAVLPAPPVDPLSQGPSEGSPPVIVADKSKPPRAPWPKLRAGLGTGIAFGLAPAAAVGFSAQIGIRWSPFSVSLEGRADLPAGSDALRIQTSMVAGTLLPCAHLGFTFVCGLVTVGSRRASSLVDGSHDSALSAGAGARIGLEVPFASDRFVARLSGDIVGTVQRQDVRVSIVTREDRWTTPAVSGGPGLGLLVNF
jgi:hypothetical protein